MTDLRFILTHYEPDAFRPRLRFYRPFMRHTRAVAAAAATAVVLVAAACYFVITSRPEATPVSVPPEQAAPAPAGRIYTEVQRLEFTDASLPEVAAAIERTYGVTVSGMDGTDPDIRLTLSYEGTATDLIDTINDLTGASLQIR